MDSQRPSQELDQEFSSICEFTCRPLHVRSYCQSTLWHIQGLLQHVHLLEMPAFTSASVAGRVGAQLAKVKSSHCGPTCSALPSTGMWSMHLLSTQIGLSLALYGGVTVQDLAWEILGVDLEETPLPRAACGFTCHSKGDATQEGWPQPKDLRPPLVCSAAHCATSPSCTSISPTS